MLSILSLAFGIILFISGRQFFWLFVAAAGFLAGAELAPRFLIGPAWSTVAIGAVFAIAGALLAVSLKKIAIGVSGFLMGALAFTDLGTILGLTQGNAYWAFFLTGGLGGAILLSLFFDLALIWLSSLIGTILVFEFVPLQGVFRTLTFVAVLFLGVIIQSSQWRDDDE